MRPRTVVTMLPDLPKPPEPIMGLSEMEAAILAELRHGFDFVPSAETGLLPERPGDEYGWLFRSCLLSQLRAALSIQGELEDGKIVEALDALSKEKVILIWKVSASRFLPGSDLIFHVVLGSAFRGYRTPYTMPQIVPQWLDFKSFKRVGKRTLNVTEAVSAVRKQCQERLDKAFGRAHMPDFGLESRLHREKVEDEARLKAAILKLAGGCLDKTATEKLVRMVDEDEK